MSDASGATRVDPADQPSRPVVDDARAANRSTLPALQRQGEGPGLIMQALQGLDEVVAAHSTWLKSWHVSVLSGLSGESGDGLPIRPDLEQWLRVFSHQVLAGHPASADAIDRLRVMQEQADEIAAVVRQSGTMPSEIYSGFMSTVLEFTSAVRDLQNDTWKRLANVDPLTGLGNRQAMWRRLAVESERHERNRQPCCVAMIDLDGFKPVNDSYGHAAGDAVLISTASLLAACIRPYDSIFRFGGDEFLICLPNTDARAAWAIIERLRLKVANNVVPLRPGLDIRTTLSIGIAPLCGTVGVDKSLEHADEALYSAKRNGRNTVYVWSERE